MVPTPAEEPITIGNGSPLAIRWRKDVKMTPPGDGTSISAAWTPTSLALDGASSTVAAGLKMDIDFAVKGKPHRLHVEADGQNANLTFTVDGGVKAFGTGNDRLFKFNGNACCCKTTASDGNDADADFHAASASDAGGAKPWPALDAAKAHKIAVR